MPSAPRPFHILRSHSAPLSALSFNPSNVILYVGDQEGYVSITDLRTRRVITQWKAHEGGVLSLQEWNGQLITHGRDNTILVHEATSIPSTSRSPQKISSTLTTNSLNFCRFSLCPVPISLQLSPRSSVKSHASMKDIGIGSTPTKGKGRAAPEEITALLAVPALIDSELIDIYALPSLKRLHASINLTKNDIKPYGDSVVPPEGRSGLVMSVHLAFSTLGVLTSIIGFEDGRVEVWQCDGDTGGWNNHWDARMSDGPSLWTKKWQAKGHNEAVMAMVVDNNLSKAFTVSADHLIVQYDLLPIIAPSSDLIPISSEGASAALIKPFPTGQIGNASIAISADGKVVAVGGWDGNIRLFSASSLKPLGALHYHRETVHVLAFANLPDPESEIQLDVASTLDIGNHSEESDKDEDDSELDGVPPRYRWLASGGKDKRVSLWGLKAF